MTAKIGKQSAWSQHCSSNVVLEFIDITLRGCAQVMFQNNPLTGLFFFAAIFVGAYAEGNPAAAWGCVLGTVVATLTGALMPDKKSWKVGLFGYNGCLVGVALPTFLEPNTALWACIVLGSIVSVIVLICIADILKVWKVAALTAPFVLVSWIIFLASYDFSALHNIGLPAPALPQPIVIHEIASNSFVVKTFNGISEVFLFSSLIAGILFVIGLAVESIWAAVFAVGGAILALLTAMGLGANPSTIDAGLYSFSAVLTAIALGSTFNKPSMRVILYTIVGVIFTVIVQSALGVLLSPVGIPTLTMPFVIASWLFLVPNKDVMPEHRK